MTLLTSLPPSLHRVQLEGDSLDSARITLAERFREGGYQTAAFVTGPTLHAAWGFDQGFDVYHNTMAFGADDFRDNDPTMPSLEVRRRSQQIVTGPAVGSLVTHWIEQEARPPFFLFVHLWDPH